MNNSGQDRIVCFGAVVMDRKYHAAASVEYGTSNPVSSVRSYGGVARNVAENLARLQILTSMVSAVGQDASGQELIQALALLAVDVSGISLQAGYNTAEYAAILQPDRNLAFGLADMDIFDSLNIEKLHADWPLLRSAARVFADCNLPQATLHALIRRSKEDNVRLAVDAVSAHKVMRLPEDLSGIDILFMNQGEAIACLSDSNAATATPQRLLAQLAQRGARAVVMTMGADGVLLTDGSGVQHLPAVKAQVVDVTGAGDALVSGTLYGLHHGRPLLEAVRIGSHLARLTLETDNSVRQDLHPAMLHADCYMPMLHADVHEAATWR